MPNMKFHPPVARSTVENAAIEAAKRHGYDKMTREQIATLAAVAPGSVSLKLGSMPEVRRLVMTIAVERGIVEIIGQGLAARDAIAQSAPAALKHEALSNLAA